MVQEALQLAKMWPLTKAKAVIGIIFVVVFILSLSFQLTNKGGTPTVSPTKWRHTVGGGDGSTIKPNERTGTIGEDAPTMLH